MPARSSSMPWHQPPTPAGIHLTFYPEGAVPGTGLEERNDTRPMVLRRLLCTVGPTRPERAASRTLRSSAAHDSHTLPLRWKSLDGW